MAELQPPLGQVLGAGFTAAFAAVTPFALFVASGDQAIALLAAAYLFGLPVALLHAFLLGLPAYHLLRRRWALTWTRSALGGLIVGGLPTALVAMLVSGFHQDALWVAGIPAALGGLGGLAFRAMVGRPRGTGPSVQRERAARCRTALFDRSLGAQPSASRTGRSGGLWPCRTSCARRRADRG
jgi:hypothetical protein